MQKETAPEIFSTPIEEIAKLTADKKAAYRRTIVPYARSYFVRLENDNAELVGKTSVEQIIKLLVPHRRVDPSKPPETFEAGLKRATDNFDGVFAALVDYMRENGLTKWEYTPGDPIQNMAVRPRAKLELGLDPIDKIFTDETIDPGSAAFIKKELSDFAEFLQRGVTACINPKDMVGHLIRDSVDETSLNPANNSSLVRTAIIKATVGPTYPLPSAGLPQIRAAFCKNMF